MTDFDTYFQTKPIAGEKPLDWEKFWKSELQKLKKIPLELKVVSKKTSIKKPRKIIDLEFTGINKYRLTAKLIAPVKLLKKTPTLIVFPDYMEDIKEYEKYADAGLSLFIVCLRGHEENMRIAESEGVDSEESTSKEEAQASYGYFKENLLNKNDYYLRHLYLDAYRSMEALRLQINIDKQKIFILGKGNGSAMALFVHHFMQRGEKIVLLEPSYSNYSNVSDNNKTLTAIEIKEYILNHKTKKREIEKNLKYFDTVFLTDKLRIPVMMIVDFQNKNSYPQGSFALFHSIKTDKDMHILVENPLKNNEKEKLKLVIDLIKEE
ncbi:MAG: acetylxylan esterase [Leptospirales bacterium]